MPAVLPLAFQFYRPLISFSAEATLGQSATSKILYPTGSALPARTVLSMALTVAPRAQA